VGAFLAAYKSDDHWWLGNNEAHHRHPERAMIDLTLNNGVSSPIRRPARRHFLRAHEHWTGLNTALFLPTKWKIDQWLFERRLPRRRAAQDQRHQSRMTLHRPRW